MPVEQMNISLPPKMARFIRGKVKAGDYTNASEVVRDAVRHMQEVEAAKKDRHALAAIGDPDDAVAAVREGYAAMRRGDYTDIDGDAELKAYLDDVRERARKELAPGRNRRSRTRA
jgi:putative addiction module CopG family antidote